MEVPSASHRDSDGYALLVDGLEVAASRAGALDWNGAVVWGAKEPEQAVRRLRVERRPRIDKGTGAAVGIAWKRTTW
jgi:hypothetical protein